MPGISVPGFFVFVIDCAALIGFEWRGNFLVSRTAVSNQVVLCRHIISNAKRHSNPSSEVRLPMRVLQLAFSYFVVIWLAVAPASAQSTWSNDTNTESRIEELLKKMTLDEKIGQLVTYSAGAATGPGTGRTDYKEMIAKGQLGSLFNLTGAAETNAMQKIAVENSRLHIPLLFGLDVIHGYRTEFPVPLGLSATWDPALVERTARVAAKEASRAGVRWTYSPDGRYRPRCPLGTHRRGRG